MREPAMAEHVTVVNAETKADRVEIRNGGEQCTRDPIPRRYSRTPERRPDRNACYGVREDGRHRTCVYDIQEPRWSTGKRPTSCASRARVLGAM